MNRILINLHISVHDKEVDEAEEGSRLLVSLPFRSGSGKRKYEQTPLFREDSCIGFLWGGRGRPSKERTVFRPEIQYYESFIRYKETVSLIALNNLIYSHHQSWRFTAQINERGNRKEYHGTSDWVSIDVACPRSFQYITDMANRLSRIELISPPTMTIAIGFSIS